MHMWGGEAQLHVFLTTALNGGVVKLRAPYKELPGTHSERAGGGGGEVCLDENPRLRFLNLRSGGERKEKCVQNFGGTT
jgi:hypothetical protein